MSSNNRYRVLSTKELAPDLVTLAAAQGIDIVSQSFINIQPVVTDALKERVHQLLLQKVYVVFTSANAVSTIADHYLNADGKYYYGNWIAGPPNITASEITEGQKGGFHSPGWEAFCLDGTTRLALKGSGIRNQIIGTAPNAAELATRIIEQGDVTSVVFFCGNQRRDDLPDILRNNGITVEEIVVYQTTGTPAIVTEEYHGIFFLSPSAVESFFSVNRISPHTVCFSIGYTTARSVRGFTDNNIITSTGRSMAEMVQTAIFHFNNINC